MSNVTFINDALSLIGVLPSGVDANADDGALALRTADEMIDEWAEDGIVVNWSAGATLDDDCPLTGNALTAVKHHLAIRLCPHFGREPSASLIAIATSAYAKLARKLMVDAMTAVTVPLPQAEGGLGYGYDITTDS